MEGEWEPEGTPPNDNIVDELAHFLASVCPQTLEGVKFLSATLPAPEAFAAALHRYDFLQETAQKARSEKDFTIFWSTFTSKSVSSHGSKIRCIHPL